MEEVEDEQLSIQMSEKCTVALTREFLNQIELIEAAGFKNTENRQKVFALFASKTVKQLNFLQIMFLNHIL